MLSHKLTGCCINNDNFRKFELNAVAVKNADTAMVKLVINVIVLLSGQRHAYLCAVLCF